MKDKILLSEESCGLYATSLKYFKCSKCEKEKASVVKIKKKIICLNCRYNDIGKDALYESLYNGLD